MRESRWSRTKGLARADSMIKVLLSYAGDGYKGTGCLTDSVKKVSMNKFDIEDSVVVRRRL